jgi:hypothetical protein
MAVGHAADLGAVGEDAGGVDPGSTGVEGEPGGTVADRGLLAALLVAVNLPIVVATTRALARGWLALGDHGLLLVRARDVGTEHHPLLGSWTSASWVLGTHVNNPGPLYLDLLALPVRLLGPWVGLAVGVMLVNMAASTLAVLAARRLIGVESMVAVAIALVGLQWALGSELLFDVWQPNALVLPCFAFLVVVAVLATGDVAMVPWVVGLGSLLVQTHMSHAVLVGLLGLACAALGLWARRRGGGRGRWLWAVPATAVVAVAAWSQPVVEQLTVAGEGNLSRLAGAAAEADQARIGWVAGGRLLTEVAVMGPWFTRSSYETALPSAMPDELVDVVGPVPSTIALVALGSAFAMGARRAARRGRKGVAATLTMAVVALAAAYVAVATAPPSDFGIVPHQIRWLWPVAAFVTAAALAALMTALRPMASFYRRAIALGTVAAVVVALANLPTDVSTAGPAGDGDHLAAARDLMSQLDSLEGRGTILYDTSMLLFGEPYSGLTLAELQDRGIPFVVASDDDVYARQLGESRRDDGSARLRLWQVVGPSARTDRPGAERVAYAEGPEGPVALFLAPIV